MMRKSLSGQGKKWVEEDLGDEVSSTCLWNKAHAFVTAAPYLALIQICFYCILFQVRELRSPS